MTKQITLLHFASIRTTLPSQPSSTLIPLPYTPFPLSSLRTHLIETTFPGEETFAEALRGAGWAVDEEQVESEMEGEVMLRGGETVVALPPVSGG